MPPPYPGTSSTGPGSPWAAGTTCASRPRTASAAAATTTMNTARPTTASTKRRRAGARWRSTCRSWHARLSRRREKLAPCRSVADQQAGGEAVRGPGGDELVAQLAGHPQPQPVLGQRVVTGADVAGERVVVPGPWSVTVQIDLPGDSQIRTATGGAPCLSPLVVTSCTAMMTSSIRSASRRSPANSVLRPVCRSVKSIRPAKVAAGSASGAACMAASLSWRSSAGSTYEAWASVLRRAAGRGGSAHPSPAPGRAAPGCRRRILTTAGTVRARGCTGPRTVATRPRRDCRCGSSPPRPGETLASGVEMAPHEVPVVGDRGDGLLVDLRTGQTTIRSWSPSASMSARFFSSSHASAMVSPRADASRSHGTTSSTSRSVVSNGALVGVAGAGLGLGHQSPSSRKRPSRRGTRPASSTWRSAAES